jgi:TatD DNase family protein
MNLVDIGANLTHQRFEKDIERIIDEAKLAGVSQIIVTGTNLQSSQDASQLCLKRAGLFSTAGIHPHDASSYDTDTSDRLESLLLLPKAVAVGETGLDFNRNFSSKKTQIYAFEAQIQLAINIQKPLFLHERDAFDTQYAILNNVNKHISGAVVHCFTGGQAELEQYLALGLYIGITGWICDERRGEELRDIIQLIPDDKLLIETDAPYLTPRTLSGKARKQKNTPANLAHIAEQISVLRQQSFAQLCTLTTANAKRLFNI